MSDERLRNLGRRSAESGSLEETSAHLAELLRAGVLTRERLELAAYCGHEAANAVIGGLNEHAYYPSHAPPPPLDSESRCHFWVQGLERWGQVAETIAAAAALELGLELWTRETDDRPRRYVKAVRAWLANPCDETASVAARLSLDHGSLGAVNANRSLLLSAYELAGFPSRREETEIRSYSGGSAAYSAVVGVLAAFADQAPGAAGVQTLFTCMRSTVIVWALDDDREGERRKAAAREPGPSRIT